MFDAAQNQPLTLRMRPDLIAHSQLRRGRRCWVIKDPVSLRYHQLRDEEYTVLKLLDGDTSMSTIRETFERKFAPCRLTNANLQGLLSLLYRQGLVLGDAPGQGSELSARHSREESRRRLDAMSNVLAIRFRGVDPERFLNTIYPLVRSCFSPLAIVAACLLGVGAFALMCLHFDDVQARLPDYKNYFTVQNMLLLVVAIGATKVLHELGHALACKHFGGECHEIGFMLLVFTPCLYCNVSDAWLLSSKWKRIAVSAAGIYVELVLASLAAFIWYWSEPGWLNSLCLNVVLVCSIGTLLLNGNPLLRYDGYFILADWLDVPNLWQRSRAVVGCTMSRLFLGTSDEDDATSLEDRPLTLLLYGVASIAYVWVVMIAIMWFLWDVLAPFGLQFAVQCMLILIVIRMVVVPVYQMTRHITRPTTQPRLNQRAALFRCGLACGLLVVVLAVPLPNRVAAPMIIQAADADRVYVTAAGQLLESLVVGTKVQANDVIAQLDDPELRRAIVTVESELRSQQAHLRHLEAMRAVSPEIANEIPVAKAAVRDAQSRLDQMQADAKRLTIRASRAGTILATPACTTETSERQLRNWTDPPLAASNLGCYLERGTLCCLVGNPKQHTANIFIAQQDTKSVRVGQDVRLRMDQHAGLILTGKLEQIAKVDAKSIPPQLAPFIAVRSRRTSNGSPQTVDVWHQARVTITGPTDSVVNEAHGQAKIIVAPTSLGWRLYRYLSRTFAFRI